MGISLSKRALNRIFETNDLNYEQTVIIFYERPLTVFTTLKTAALNIPRSLPLIVQLSNFDRVQFLVS